MELYGTDRTNNIWGPNPMGSNQRKVGDLIGKHVYHNWPSIGNRLSRKIRNRSQNERIWIPAKPFPK